MLIVDEADDLRGGLAGMKLFMGTAVDLDGDPLGVTHQGDLGGGLPAPQRMDQRRSIGESGVFHHLPQTAVHGQRHSLVDRHSAGRPDPVGDQPPGALVLLPGQDLARKGDQPLHLLQLKLRRDVVQPAGGMDEGTHQPFGGIPVEAREIAKAGGRTEQQGLDTGRLHAASKTRQTPLSLRGADRCRNRCWNTRHGLLRALLD